MLVDYMFSIRKKQARCIFRRAATGSFSSFNDNSQGAKEGLALFCAFCFFEIHSLDDFKGLKMRIPGLAGEVFAKLGVNVTNIPAGELYTSLDRGTIDALEGVDPGMDIRMGFQ